MSTNYYRRALELMERNMNREINAIPCPFPNLEMYYAGIEHGTYNIVTASSGVGKSQFTDYLFMHHPIWYAYKNPEKLRVKIFYFSLEMNPVIKAMQCLAHKIYMDSPEENRVRIGIKNMQSVKGHLTPEQLEQFKGYNDYFDWFYQTVEMNPGPIVPFGIYKEIYDFYDKNGTIHTKEAYDHHYDPKTGKEYVTKRAKGVFDYYVPNDPDLFVILIIDHAALVQRQKGLNKRENMELLSEYLMTLRNQFGLVVASIQQQASDQEAKDNYRRPTLSGLGDNKALQRDADIIFGLYDPMRHNERKVNGYDVRKMHNRYRELLLMKGRYGPSSISTDLFYDGTVEMFYEMPDALTKHNDPTVQKGVDEAIATWYKYAKNLEIVM